jgi:hypothetical protein
MCNDFGRSFLQIGVLFSPVVFDKGTDWCILAFDDAMACAIPLELTLNYGAICLFLLVCLSVCFSRSVSILLLL